MISINYDDFNVICRFCLRKDSKMKFLHEPNIVNMISYCKFLNVAENVKFPNKICTSCERALDESYKFKQLCSQSQITIRKIVIDNNKTTFHYTSNNDYSIFNKNTEDINDDKNVFYSDNSNEEFLHSSKNDKSFCSETIYLSEFKCNKCKSVFKSELELHDHLNNEHESVNNVISEDLTSFLDDMSSSPLAYPCKICSQSFDLENDLKLHTIVHTDGELKCPKCLKTFINRRILKRHVKIHMENKPHVCQKCGKGFAESHSLTKHMLAHLGIAREKKHVCKECGQGFSEPFYLKVHIRKHTGERPLICKCGKSFADPRSLRTHTMIHTGEKPYKCKYCPKAFNQNVNLTKHVRIHTGEKPYICNLCDKRFTQSASLDKHSRTHTGEKPFSCDLCPKKFSEKGTLVNHIRTHTGEKPYVCAICGRAYGSSSELRLHDRKHSGIKRNVCEVCGKDFPAPSNLLIHSRTHTGEKPFECDVCTRRFVDKSSLKKHCTLHQVNRRLGVRKNAEIESL